MASGSNVPSVVNRMTGGRACCAIMLTLNISDVAAEVMQANCISVAMSAEIITRVRKATL